MIDVDDDVLAQVRDRRDLDAGVLDAVAWTRTGAWHVLGHRFAVRTTDDGLADHLAHLYAAFDPIDPDGDGLVVYSALPHDGEGDEQLWALFEGDRKLTHRVTVAGVVAMLQWRCNRETIDRVHEPYLALHAGCVARDGRAVLLAAPQESGKTTLTTALMQRGFDYLTDEAACIDRGTGQLAAYPKALSIDRGSWPLFGSLAPRDGAERYVDDQWHVTAPDVGSSVVATATPAVLVAPNYVRGHARGPVDVGPAAMLRLFAESTFHFPEHAVDDLRQLARLVEGCRYVRLEVDDLDTACDTITALLEDDL